MKKLLAVAVAAAAFAAPAFANVDKMVGNWKWTDYTVACAKGGDNGMSCKVTAGPKNVGMEMIKSKLEAKDGAYVGKIAHPATGDIYNTKMSLKDDNTWSMDGCTDKGVCAKGDFTRIK
jgi:uncharacterized protein (DUF2147 family)